MRVLRAISFAVIVAISVLSQSLPAANITDFIGFSLRAPNNSIIFPGLLHVPPEAAIEPRPLILFLHGSGESGTDNRLQINGNIDNLLAEAKQRGAFLYAPQTNSGWGNDTVLMHTMTMLDRAITERGADPNHVYVTGLSMGGGGVWNFLHDFPDRFAAGVPICAVGPTPPYNPANLVDKPIWAFHARNDATVSANSSRNVINSILITAGEPLPAYPALNDFASNFHFDNSLLDLHYTELRTGGHGIWGGVYRTEPMYDWLFSHSLVPEPSSLVLLGGILVLFVTRRRVIRIAVVSSASRIPFPEAHTLQS